MVFIRDADGAAASEYALLVMLIAIAILAAVTAFGNKLSGLYTNNTDQIVKALP